MASLSSRRNPGNSFASIFKATIQRLAVQLKQRENFYLDGSTIRFCYEHIDYSESDLLLGGFSDFPKGRLPTKAQFSKAKETSSSSAAPTIGKQRLSAREVEPLPIEQPTNKPSAIPDWASENEVRSCSSYSASYTIKQHQIDIDKRLALALKRPAVKQPKVQPAAKRTKIVRPFWWVDDGLHRDWDYSAEYTKEQHQLDIDERLASYKEQQARQSAKQPKSSSRASANKKAQRKKQESDNDNSSEDDNKVAKPSNSPKKSIPSDESSVESEEEDEEREEQSEKFNTLVVARYLQVVADHQYLEVKTARKSLTDAQKYYINKKGIETAYEHRRNCRWPKCKEIQCSRYCDGCSISTKDVPGPEVASCLYSLCYSHYGSHIAQFCAGSVKRLVRKKFVIYDK